ncbi:MAG: FlgD immunoglobulin-like domain containing protein [Breznakiellaceae bacterium]
MTLTNAGALTISAPLTARGGFTQNGAGAVSLAANITTTGDGVSFLRAVTLGAGVAIDTTNAGANPAGGNINFQNTLSGAYNITLASGTSGAITVSGNVGATPLTPLGVLSITNCNGASFNGSVSAASFSINGVSAGQTVTVVGALNLTTGLTTAGGNYNIALNAGAVGQTSVIAGTTTFNNTGTLTLGDDAADSITFTGGVTATAPSQVNLAGTIATGGGTGENISLGDTDTSVVLVANTTLNTETSGTVTIGTTVSIPTNTTLDLTSSNFNVTEIDFTDNTSIFRLTGNQTTHTITTLDTSQGIVEYYGAAGTIFATDFGSAPGNNYPSLRIAAGSGTKTLAGDIVVHGNWTNAAGFAGFNSQAGTVIFTGSAEIDNTIEIRGSNEWYIFECTTAGLKILFENTASPTIQRIKAGGVFRVKGAAGSGNSITLERLNNTGTPANPPTGTDDQHFWFFELIPGATLDMEYVKVYYSNARKYPVSIPSTVDAYPYSTYYCYKWLKNWFAIYSYTEDSDYNGKIDRLRVECEGFVGDDFSGFQVEVKNRDTGEAYQVTGYSRPEVGPNFYIYLQEKPYLDGGAVLLWRVVQNTTLVDGSMGDKFVGNLESNNSTLKDTSDGDFGDWMITIDTVWPVVGYTLALPGQNQVFIHFSEPVVTSTGDMPGESNLGLNSGLTVVSGSGNGIREALGDVATPPTASDIAAGSINLTFTGTLKDMGQEPYWEALYYNQVIGAPDPSYPPSSGYTATPSTYNRSATRPAFDLQGGAGKTSHRISDVLISVPPASAADDRYFVWPLWARDSVTIEVAESQYETAFPTGSDAAGQTIGLVRDFTGTQWLRDQDITMQVRVNPDLSPTNLSLHFDASAASSFRATAANGPVGLWLPVFNNGGLSGAAFSGIVPWPNDSSHGGGTSLYAGTKQGAVLPASALWNFNIPASDPRVRSVSTLDFFFTLDNGSITADPLYVARLDVAPGAVIPADWYRRVRPFSFDIHDVTKQRSSATILNNVIDPTKGERVRLSYQLTKAGQVTIQVFTLDGDLVQVLYRGYREAGDYTVSWDGKNRGGRVVARGMYFIRIVGPDIDEIRKVMVVKE